LINIELDSYVLQLDEVVIADSATTMDLSSQISIKSIPLKEVKQLPFLLGEVDLLKAAQLLPGIQSGNEGTSGLIVRGGSNDQNLYLIDGTPVYNITHLLGFVSVINEDAVTSMDVITGGFPARYHGRLSSVVDIKTKEGNLNKYEGGFAIGLVAAKFNVNGPIKKGKGSFFISGRRSYIDWLARPIIKDIADGAIVKLYFYDLNAKANYTLSKKSRIYFSTYFGKDVYGNQLTENSGQNTIEINEDGLNWGNFLSSLRWNYLWNNKLFSNLSISYTRFKYVNEKFYKEEFPGGKQEYTYQFSSGINDLSTRLTFDYYANQHHTLKFGIEYTHHLFKPGITTEFNFEDETNISERDTSFGFKNINAPEFSAFIEDLWVLNSDLVIRPGISVTSYLSPGVSFTSFEPRLSVNYNINSKTSIKFGYARMSQFVHLLRFSTLNLPTDLWVPSLKNSPPEISDQFTIGMAFNSKKNIGFSIEAFYKNMDNLIEYSEGASFFAGDNNWENKIETGKGWAYGIELMVKKNYGKLTGWISYTWSKSERQFTNINLGEPFPFRFDRRNDLSIVATYKFNNKIDAGMVWVYGTGHPVTLATDKYASYFLSTTGGLSVPSGRFTSVSYFPNRNNYKMPDYHRLDVNFNFHKEKKYGERIFSTGIYNVYNRQNAFYLQERGGKLYKVSIFPIMPFIRLTLKFY
jgi:hypothetical protein